MNRISEAFLNVEQNNQQPHTSKTTLEPHEDFRAQIQEMKDNLYKQKAKFEQNMRPTSNTYKGIASESEPVRNPPAVKKSQEMKVADLNSGLQKENR